MHPTSCNRSPDDHESPKKPKPPFNLKSTLFKSPNPFRLTACLAFAILLNVLIIIFFFRGSPPSPSSSISQKFEASIAEKYQYFEAPVVEQYQHPQHIEAPELEEHRYPPKTEGPALQQKQIEAPSLGQYQYPRQIEAPAAEQYPYPQQIEAPALKQYQYSPQTEVPALKQHQHPQKIEAHAVEHDRHPQLNEAVEVELHQDCKSGKVFVYDMPPIFNKELLDNCHELDPWNSLCNAMSNGGLGPKATGLASVVPKSLEHVWYWTDMYSAEVIYHSRMLNYSCRTQNPDEATAFYLPFYVGFAVGKYLWGNYTAKDRDRLGEMALDWVKNQPSWKRFNGSDHFIIFGRLTWDFRRLTNNDSEWGSSFIYMPLMKNVLRVSVERNPWDPLEISVPYPTAFHPRSESDIIEWQSYVRARKRTSLFCFVGATRNKIKNDFRGVLMNYCKNESESCRVVDCSVTRCYDGAPAILEAFLDSDFCFQPKGDGFTRRSFFDCMLAGSIPVYFWKRSFEGQYQWHLPLSGRSNSVFIDQNDVRNETSIIRKVLEGYSKEEVKTMRENVIDMIPRFLYAMSSEGLGKNSSTKDAFDISVEGVLRKFHQQRRN